MKGKFSMEEVINDVNELESVPFKDIVLTTEDNPFDPFTQPDRWLKFDADMGYDTWGNIVRLAHLSKNLTPEEEKSRIRWAMISLMNTGLVRGSYGYSRYRYAIEGETSVF